jgi:outer membrane receptor protein involved in Fe transport
MKTAGHRIIGCIRFGCILLTAVGLAVPAVSGTRGKIAGTIVDGKTGVPLPGANVLVQGLALGAATDTDGNYTILEVPPGTVTVVISLMGYARTSVEDVRVLIDQTARVDLRMRQEVLRGEAVTVAAKREAVRPDVATSVTSVTAEEVRELPVSNVENVVSLQAGIQGGFQIRGSSADEALILMDGITLRDPRNNSPVSSIPLSAIKEISIERGGFNAEYGQVRSGIVNVVTREGGKSGYQGSVEFKIAPPGMKNFGISPFDRNGFFLKPYFDDEVCWMGTAGEPFTDMNGDANWQAGETYTDVNGDGRWSGWDKYTRLQYPDFEGWNAISERLMSDSDPTNDLSPLGAQRMFMWETRKKPVYDQQDYNIDAGFGGPIPLIGRPLGNLRFFTSYRRNRSMLVVPLSRPDYVDYDWSMKLTTDLSPDMHLVVTGLIGKQYTMMQNWASSTLRDAATIASVIGNSQSSLFGTGIFSPTDISHQNLSAKFTHALNSKTFYEVSLERFARKYWARKGAQRDTARIYEIVPGIFVDEAPFGYDPDDRLGISGMVFGGFTCKQRDNTRTASTTLKADMTSQVNFANLVKAGVEFTYSDLRFDYGTVSNYFADSYDVRVRMNQFPYRAAAYVQDKLESKGFIMNAGLRLDVSNSNSEWWNVDPYNAAFFTRLYSEDMEFPMKKTRAQWQVSPRLGISHPITENSKLFFNYGHFKQMPSYESLFRIGRSNDHMLTLFGDPDLILAKTISYELGFDYAFLDNALLAQVAAFYHDISDQQNATQYLSVGGVSYQRSTSNSYEDIRGFELTLRKNRGRWWTFFGNYTYQVTTSGHFGREQIFEDPSLQREYDESTVNLYQDRPTPRPYARVNVSLVSPAGFGPRLLGGRPMSGFLANVLLGWQAGQWETWNPKQIRNLTYNVQRKAVYTSVLRLSKSVRFRSMRMEGFVDVENLFNLKRMSLANFGGKASDRDLYYNSLHLPKSKAYDNIPGDDRIGEYRRRGVAYQPMFGRGTINYASDTGDPGVLYYDRSTGRTVEYAGGAWADVSESRLNRILDDKAYIDMPAVTSFTFLNPRQVFFGVRMTLDLR